MDRDARLVEVAPRDAYRYGYRLWIDEKTAMPLKTQLCDERGNVIEQIVFASLALSQRIPDSAFEPQVSTEGFRWLRQETRAPLSASQPALWSALRLPPGFRMTSQGHQVMPGADGPVAHLVFSDGVASVSVFVESARAAAGAPPRLDGATNVGASAAYSTVVDGHQVTAVGEVPAQTVRFIADQVRAARPTARPAGVPGVAPALRSPPGGPPVQAPAFAPGPSPRR
jgi:sigma-E factor negative regulatory protein RseB